MLEAQELVARRQSVVDGAIATEVVRRVFCEVWHATRPIDDDGSVSAQLSLGTRTDAEMLEFIDKAVELSRRALESVNLSS